MNSSVMFDRTSSRNAFSDTNVQRKILIDSIHLMENSLANTKKAKLPFQNGVIMSCRSLLNLFQEMKMKYGTSYLLTRRVNQDALENLFSIIR